MIPQSIQAGDSLAFPVSAPDHSGADGWSLKVMLRGPQAINLQSAWGSEAHQFSATASETSSWSAGEYLYSIRAERGDDAKTISAGSVRVLPDMASTEAIDARSHVKRTLDALEAAIEKRATRDQQSYEVEGKRIDRTPINDLLALQRKYTRLYRQEQEAAGLVPKRRRFYKTGLA
uniref:Uncharacterized protein n=1 Tax=viral metagenome TaxID=1070528 RepID=A0A6M3J2Y0_9ZZZZ